MKRKNIIAVLSIAIMMLFAYPTEATAQRKKRIVKHRVKKHRRTHIKARRKAHFRYRHLPRRGKVVRTVGAGFFGVRFRGIGYRFHKGVWYRPKGKRFLVTRGPVGIRVAVLPVGFRALHIQSKPYYYYYGTYYVKLEDSEEYEVINAPIGAEVEALPEGYTVVKVNGAEYYKLDEVYYEPRRNEENEEYFVVVKNPAL